MYSEVGHRVIGRAIPQANATHVLNRTRTHRFRLMAQTPRVNSPDGTLHIASAREYPISTTITGMVLKLKPGAIHEPHWHPNANEWHYVAKGQTRVTLFAPDKRLAVADLAAGDCAYIPRGCGHTVQNVGTEEVKSLERWTAVRIRRPHCLTGWRRCLAICS